MRGIRSDGHSTAGKVGDTAGGDRGRGIRCRCGRARSLSSF